MKNPENKLEIVKAIAKAHADRLRDNAARGRVQAEKCGLTPKESPGFMRGWPFLGATAVAFNCPAS